MCMLCFVLSPERMLKVETAQGKPGPSGEHEQEGLHVPRHVMAGSIPDDYASSAEPAPSLPRVGRRHCNGGGLPR